MREDMPDQTDIHEHMPYLQAMAYLSSVIIELGCGHGNGSTRALSCGLSASEHKGKAMISVDIDPMRPQIRPALDYWYKVTGSSTSPNTLENVRFILGQRPADLIFIDTVHTKEMLAQELALWSALEHLGTIWLFHDTWMFGQYNSMVEAIQEFCADGKHEYVELTKECHGMWLMRKRG